MMKKEKLDQTKKIQRSARFRITSLVMGIVLVIFVVILIVFYSLSISRLNQDANNFLSKAVALEVKKLSDNEDYNSATTDHDSDRSFIIDYSASTGNYTWRKGYTENSATCFSNLKISEQTFTTSKEYIQSGDYFVIIVTMEQAKTDSADMPFAQNDLTESSSVLLTSSNQSDVISQDVDYIVAGVDKYVERKNGSTLGFNLIYILLAIFIVLIPVVYLLSYYVSKPTIQAIKDQKDFIANASHELKTPLAIISADNTILREQHGDSQYFDTIDSQCKKMNETILDMIELSKLETTTRALEPVNVSDTLSDLSMSFDAVAYESKIDYESTIEPNLVLHKADKKDINRVFSLLIDNAIKYADGEKKLIRLSLKKEKKGYLFTSYNTGCGVLDEDRKKVFNRFYQGKSGSETERKGSGLGLAIVKEICDKFGYELKIDSKYQQFTSFTILFK